MFCSDPCAFQRGVGSAKVRLFMHLQDLFALLTPLCLPSTTLSRRGLQRYEFFRTRKSASEPSFALLPFAGPGRPSDKGLQRYEFFAFASPLPLSKNPPLTGSAKVRLFLHSQDPLRSLNPSLPSLHDPFPARAAKVRIFPHSQEHP
ncbi:MAG: hypothetical protein KatS3mg026_0552 [Bacteroidia bacterium]|nr:MAG: hypothetical protein KatS3mg026_0552 [Bacteroidia bacterium]